MSTLRHRILDVGRGALIGAAEVVPGISGGTVALVVGVYEILIGSAGHLLTALRLSVLRDHERARENYRQVRWDVVLPVMVGMITAVLIAARVLEPIVTSNQVESRAVFAGMILASLVVPAGMVGRWGPREVVLALMAAVAAVALTGLPAAEVQSPNLLVVSAAAAIAICALVLPGVSGSFLLLVFGLYAPTLAALNDRNLPYIGAFMLGAIVGLGAFVKILQWLLEHHHKMTLAIMTGLMAGPLRALWPWQDDDRSLLGPGSELPLVVLLFLFGAAVVVTILLTERYLSRKHARPY